MDHMDPVYQGQIFSHALNIHKPWYITDIEFRREERRLDIWVDFERGARFACPDCNKEECHVHDTIEKEWRHLDFFQFQTYVHCRVPRVVCEKCRIRLIKVPWSRKSSGFTSMFEAMIVLMAGDMQVSQIGEKVQETDTRLWRIIKYYVKKAVKVWICPMLLQSVLMKPLKRKDISISQFLRIQTPVG